MLAIFTLSRRIPYLISPIIMDVQSPKVSTGK